MRIIKEALDAKHSRTADCGCRLRDFVIRDSDRHRLLFQCNKGLSAAVAAEEIQALRGEEALSDRAARKWFFRLREGNFDLSDSARSSDFDEERLNALTREEP
ncbi:hypothetical protein M513_02060 [Trichuris suis]|uniref:Mos1 transposase HTH domain-containing protein n=1 Tax=Trichuris suis TaxID=68888 RepID=A0A085MIX9_9BILA|nr:hypothetical protein M513_02060 [Trichuris suis]